MFDSRIAALAFILMVPVSVSAECPGDCGDDGTISIADVALGLRIALGEARSDRCGSIDRNDDGVTIDDIVRATHRAHEGCPIGDRRLIASSREGRIASIDGVAPWTVRASSDLGHSVASIRCRGGRCVAVHPAADSVSIVDAADLSVHDTIQLDRGADPRDVAMIDADRVVISQYGRAHLLSVNLTTGVTTGIDLSPLADDDGLPEPLRFATCGQRIFVQLLRIDHATEAPTAIGAALAVVDLDPDGSGRVIDTDPTTPGVQGIALAGRPNFDMPVDCPAGILYVAEPLSIRQGGGWYEQVDLTTLQARDLPIDIGAEVGGFEVVAPGVFWIITHTVTGPAPSSHLNLIGGLVPDTHNTFASEHVNDLALDRREDLLFYPDPCTPRPSNPGCARGIHIFHAHSGQRAAALAIDVGFEPIEVAVTH